MLTLTGTTKVPKVEESAAFSANHFFLKLIVPRTQPSTLAQTDHQHAIPKKSGLE